MKTVMQRKKTEWRDLWMTASKRRAVNTTAFSGLCLNATPTTVCACPVSKWNHIVDDKAHGISETRFLE